MTLCIEGGRVLRPDLRVERADVLVDADAGTVLEVGDLAGTGDERLDATDGLVVPGLVNAHTHVAMTLLRGVADDKPLDTWLREEIWPAEAAMSAADVRAGARLGVVEMIRSGTTAFSDMYFQVPEIADVVRESGLRARLGHGIVTAGKDDQGAAADLEEGLSVARELAGSDDRVRAMVCPHSLTTVDADSFEAAVAGAREIGVPVHCHAIETRADAERVVDEHGRRPLAYARERGLFADGVAGNEDGDGRNGTTSDFLAHGVHLDSGEIDLLAEHGAGMVHCPASNMKLASGTAPVPALREAGVTVGLGTDGPASNDGLDPLAEARLAALLGKVGAGDATALPARAVLAMATEDSARAAGLPAGRVEAGAPADLAVVDCTDPRLTPAREDALASHLVYAATGADVRHTVVDGRVLLCDGTVETLDPVAAREAATAAADRVRDGD
jgi:5-methylthioadenosine/S-adenosylhomocysteine deaminase